MYVPSTGRFLSRDPLPANGVELLYSFRDMTRYAYVRNNPPNSMDPTGRFDSRNGTQGTDQNSAKMNGEGEDFYICYRLVDVEGIARKCGCQHWDIYGSVSGVVYQGFYGPIEPNNQGLPTGSKWKCVKLNRRDYTRVYIIVPFFGINVPATFEWGPKKGQVCKGATSADILACLAAKPKPKGDPGLVENCQTDAARAADGCCLNAPAPLSLSPPVVYM